MKKRVLISCFIALTILAFDQTIHPQQSTNSAASPFPRQRALLDQYCVTCHNQRTQTGGLTLDRLDLVRVTEDAEVWEKVVRKLRAGLMPPSGARRPDPSTTEAFTVWLEGELDRSQTAARMSLGAPGLHRLNRTEYANAIRDLLDVEVDVTALLPPDDSSFGFDNMASSLSVSS